MKIYSEEGIINVPDGDGKQLDKYQLVSAGGGVVINSEGQVLMIFRRGKWDLPKGKAEHNEPIELCAERETKEETGLKELTLQRPLLVTHHTYIEKGQQILKETHWFLYFAQGTPELTPQTNEDIFKAEWVSRRDLKEYTNNTFPLIEEVLSAAGLR